MSDAQLKSLIEELEQEERDVSYRRRLLHGKIDILRLTEILTGKAAPPA
jgi:hypothetical protein